MNNRELNIIISDKIIDVHICDKADAPLVILNSFIRDKGILYQTCCDLGCPKFHLAEISNINWDDDLSPWYAPPLDKEDVACNGKADAFLDLLLNSIIPSVKAELVKAPSSVIIAGYSLAGLFALYSAIRCDSFDAVVSCSGSLWFPGFIYFVKHSDISKLPNYIYFSLGDREAHTSNLIVDTVEKNTRELCDFFTQNGIVTTFELNKGDHRTQPMFRTAKGIKWALDRV